MTISHFDIADDTELPISISYQKNRDNAGPAQVHDLHRFGSDWRIYPGDPTVTWDGMAVVNQGETAADLIVWQVDPNGSLIRGPITVINQLPPHAKELYLFANDFENEPTAYFEATSSQPLAVMALRGNQASDFIWENAAIPLPEPEPAPIPPARIDYAMAFDPTKRLAIMVGGFDQNFDLLDDTWFWNGRRWRHIETDASPLPRSHHGGAFDDNAQKMIIFGGFENQLQKRNDFMAFDGSNWLALNGGHGYSQGGRRTRF